MSSLTERQNQIVYLLSHRGTLLAANDFYFVLAIWIWLESVDTVMPQFVIPAPICNKFCPNF